MAFSYKQICILQHLLLYENEFTLNLQFLVIVLLSNQIKKHVEALYNAHVKFHPFNLGLEMKMLTWCSVWKTCKVFHTVHCSSTWIYSVLVPVSLIPLSQNGQSALIGQFTQASAGTAHHVSILGLKCCDFAFPFLQVVASCTGGRNAMYVIKRLQKSGNLKSINLVTILLCFCLHVLCFIAWFRKIKDVKYRFTQLFGAPAGVTVFLFITGRGGNKWADFRAFKAALCNNKQTLLFTKFTLTSLPFVFPLVRWKKVANRHIHGYYL